MLVCWQSKVAQLWLETWVPTTVYLQHQLTGFQPQLLNVMQDGVMDMRVPQKVQGPPLLHSCSVCTMTDRPTRR